MAAILGALRAPGAMRDVVVTAPTQARKFDKDVASVDSEERAYYHVEKKTRRLDRWLDRIVEASGSVTMFIVVQSLLFAWAFLGIAFSKTAIWPIVISNVQAIFSYGFDSLLMRQQLNGYQESLKVAATLQSRGDSTGHMLNVLSERVQDDITEIMGIMDGHTQVTLRLPKQDRFGRIVAAMSHVLGHILFIAFYWAAIMLWLAFGPKNAWSSEWQLDINSATSALMVFAFSFIAIVRERHSKYMRVCVDAIFHVDCLLEKQLRDMTDHETSNPEALVRAPNVSVVQRMINYYADVVGTLVGIALLIVALIAWLCIGPVLNFDANWWLIIGTYAGLIGLNDGFVLRNVQALQRKHETAVYAQIDASDRAVFERLGLRPPQAEPVDTRALTYRVSEAMNGVCGHEVTVVVGVLFIIGLLVGASAMRWSETGQLLCNVPPSIIETFFMIVLITGHNASEKQRRVDLTNAFDRRCQLLAFVEAAQKLPSSRLGNEKRVKELKAMEDMVLEETAVEEVALIKE